MSEKKGKCMPRDAVGRLSARECLAVIVAKLPKVARVFCQHLIVRLESVLPPSSPPLRPITEELQNFNVGKGVVGRTIRQYLVRHRGLHIIAARMGNCTAMGRQEAAIDRWLGIMRREGLWYDVRVWQVEGSARSDIPANSFLNIPPGPRSFAADVLIEFGFEEVDLQGDFSGIYAALCDDLTSRIPRTIPGGMCVVCEFSTYEKWGFRECPPHASRHAGNIYIPMQDVLKWINAWRLRGVK